MTPGDLWEQWLGQWACTNTGASRRFDQILLQTQFKISKDRLISMNDKPPSMLQRRTVWSSLDSTLKPDIQSCKALNNPFDRPDCTFLHDSPYFSGTSDLSIGLGI